MSDVCQYPSQSAGILNPAGAMNSLLFNSGQQIRAAPREFSGPRKQRTEKLIT
ncbi:Uncharacterized protein dnm_011270 [Desulfonema magnum]|uniref:Uncharacterized protein n=1 Tax=Desulfonema magnum TaxID=45655 RepID=A0A975GLS8_9BACT|nr:Uncharacterized protein dnm_011270 [Desulfonema magnum]